MLGYELTHGVADELASLKDEIAARLVPEPKRGGTWLYCDAKWAEAAHGGTTHFACVFRTKRWKTYRQHWKRHHR